MNRMGNYDNLVKTFNSGSEYKLIHILLSEAKNFNVNFDECICYIQNLYVKDEEPILYIFSNLKILVLSIVDVKNRIVKVNIYNKDDIEEISYEKQYYEEWYKLLIIINNHKYVLEPKIDTNEYHNAEFNSIIKEIICYLK